MYSQQLEKVPESICVVLEDMRRQRDVRFKKHRLMAELLRTAESDTRSLTETVEDLLKKNKELQEKLDNSWSNDEWNEWIDYVEANILEDNAYRQVNNMLLDKNMNLNFRIAELEAKLAQAKRNADARAERLIDEM